MNLPITKTVTLKKGYIDQAGNAHTAVVLRAPTADDEIKADAEVTRMRVSSDERARTESRSPSLQGLQLLRQCTVQFGSIIAPGIDVFRSLARKEAAKLMNALYTLEDQEAGIDDDEGKQESGKAGIESEA